MLKAIEPRWHAAGRLWDMLCELATVGDLLRPREDNLRKHQGNKRPPTKPMGDLIAQAAPANDRSHSRQAMRHLKRNSLSYLPASNHMSTITTPHIVQGRLPVRTNELGRLPLHPVYGTDPFASWHEYDLSPSVFNPSPTSQNTPPPRDIEQADPTLDSVFTVPRQSRERRAISMSQIHVPRPVSSALPPPSVASTSVDPHALHSSSPPQTPLFAASSAQSVGLSTEILTMWDNAPQSFGFDDWGIYISNVNASAGGAGSSSNTSHPESSSTGSLHPGNSVYAYYDQPV